MRVEKIELIGFKSFADRTTFLLHPGITCIVGPNGCGKSNIVDAFRWVLGEQSAKSLRGEKMEEVIFNGSMLKKPKGMAEVAMALSGLNGGGQGGNGQNEPVTVTRRLYRSGESEYMLNRQQCRLKDIRDVFLDTGLDFRSYSILEQGRIGEILNAKPIERRFILEEVAGVMKYKVRRAEALSKLEAARGNLVRVSDIIAEVRKQIQILDRLAKKAERYKRLASEMHAIELKIARREYQQFHDGFERLSRESDALREQEAVLRAEASTLEGRSEAKRIALLEKEKQIEALQQDFHEMEREISEMERRIAVCNNDVANLGEYAARLVQQEQDLALRDAEILAKHEALIENRRQLEADLEGQGALIGEKREALRQIEEGLAEQEERIEERRRDLFRISEEAGTLRNEQGRQQSFLESLEKKASTVHQESDESRKMLVDIETAITGLEGEIYGKKQETVLLGEKRGVLGRELTALKGRAEEMTGSLAAVREELASCTSRLDSLQEIVLDKPTRDLLAADALVGVLGTVSDFIEVGAEYEKAVESVLADKADAFVVAKADDLRHAVSFLKGREVGKTVLISADTPPVRQNDWSRSHAASRALDLVKVKEGYEGVARNLLEDVVVVRDINEALDLHALGTGCFIVTRNGEVVEPSGAVIMGEEKGVFRRKREMRELERAIDEKHTLIDEMQRGIVTLQDALAEKDDAMKGVEFSLHQCEKDLSILTLTMENHREERERISRKLAYLTIEREEAAREKETVTAALRERERQGELLEARKTEVETELLELQQSISLRRTAKEDLGAALTELKLSAASLRERLEAAKDGIESTGRFAGEIREQREGINREKEAVEGRTADRKAEIAGEESRLRHVVGEADALRADISQRRDAAAEDREALAATDQELKTLRSRLADLASRSGEVGVQKAEHRVRIENLATNVTNNYGVEISQIELLEVSPEEEDRLVELRQKIQEIGPVNLGTLEEYEELQARYTFLSQQQEDLNKSIVELEEAITRINSTTKKKLRDAFEALRTKFGEVFLTLFGGGRAELILTDDQNILESGLDIIAQPPGKKLQNIHLLSGGEKALTALSLQFASFLIKPTPLCILDEADAPLDETNTERYARMLVDLSKDTQFIVVTHNRTTMTVAQHLYGITMEEAGVSKVISMQFAEV